MLNNKNFLVNLNKRCKKSNNSDRITKKVLEPVLNSHAFLNDLAELATMNEFLASTNLGPDFSESIKGNIPIDKAKNGLFQQFDRKQG